jgi:hypothetical protein
MAATHRLVLEGRAPALAAFYQSAGGRADEPGAWSAFIALVEEQTDTLRELVDRRCQTNEVGRSAALVGGFLTIAAESELPLRCLEVGTSAGLNLRWDHFRYEAGDRSWGDPSSPVRFHDVYEGLPPFDVPATVAERTGCDLHPVDPATDEGRITLMAHVWADQVERFRLLRGALDVAARVPATIDQADAGTWLEERLASERSGVATVVFHSIVMDQLDDHARGRLLAAIEDAGGRATPEAPFAWLRMEQDYSFALLRPVGPKVWLTLWPGGGERLLASAGAHGNPVRWRA